MRWVMLAVMLAACTGADDGAGATTTAGSTTGPGVSWSPGVWAEGPCTPGPAADATAYVQDTGHLTSWHVSASGITQTARVPSQARWLGTQDGLVAANATSAWRLDAALQTTARVDIGNITAFWASSEGIVLATGWDVVRLDADLHEVWRVRLDTAAAGAASYYKSLDHLLVDQDRVFVVDDVVMPFYGFILDLDGTLLHTVQWDSSFGPAFHAVHDGTWHVAAGFTGQGGGSNRFTRFSSDGAPLPAVVYRGYTYDLHGGGGPQSTTGHHIRAIDPTGRALLHNGSVAWVDLGETITTHCHAPAPPGTGGAIGATHVAVAATDSEVVALWAGHSVRAPGPGAPVQAVLVAP